MTSVRSVIGRCEGGLTLKRRRFLQLCVVAGGAVALGKLGSVACDRPSDSTMFITYDLTTANDKPRATLTLPDGRILVAEGWGAIAQLESTYATDVRLHPCSDIGAMEVDGP